MRQWYAIRSKPRREGAAAALLSRAEIETYVPLVVAPPKLGQPRTVEPFFPGYFFSRLDPSRGELHLARYTHGVLNIVGYGDQPCPVPDDLIKSIKERLARCQGRPLSNLQPGDRVVVTTGPFRDVDAIFDGYLSAKGRVRVLVRLLQRLCRAEVHIGQLRLIRKAASVSQG